MLLANTRLVTHSVGSASSHLIFFVGGNAPSHAITTRCNRVTSRVTQHQHRSTAKTDTKQQHSSGLALCSHVTLDVIAHQWLQPGHLLVPPATERLWMAPQKRPISRSQDAQGLELTPRTTTDFNMAVVQTPRQYHQWSSVPHPTFLASDPGATTATLSEQSPKREAWTMVTERQRPVCLLAVWRVSQQSKP